MCNMSQYMLDVAFRTFVAHYDNLIIILIYFIHEFRDDASCFEGCLVIQTTLIQLVRERLEVFDLVIAYILKMLAVVFYVIRLFGFRYHVEDCDDGILILTGQFDKLIRHVAEGVSKIV